MDVGKNILLPVLIFIIYFSLAIEYFLKKEVIFEKKITRIEDKSLHSNHVLIASHQICFGGVQKQIQNYVRAQIPADLNVEMMISCW